MASIRTNSSIIALRKGARNPGVLSAVLSLDRIFLDANVLFSAAYVDHFYSVDWISF